MKSNILSISNRISKILLIFIGIVFIGIVSFVVYRYINRTSPNPQEVSIEAFDNNIIGEIKSFDKTAKTLVVKNISTKKDKTVFIDNKTGIFKSNENVMSGLKTTPEKLNLAYGTSTELENNFKVANFNDIKKGQLVKILTNQSNELQKIIIAWEIYIIN